MSAEDNVKMNDIKIALPKPGVWRTYDATNGLPAGANCVCQDARGYLWGGMWNGGLARYDGEEFVVYTTDDGLPNNTIQALCEDANGQLWIGTNRGLARYDGKEFVVYTTDDGLPGNRVRCLFVDTDGTLWIGTEWTGTLDGGLTRYDGKEFVTYTTHDGLAYNAVYSICADANGAFWISTTWHEYDGHTRYLARYDSKEALEARDSEQCVTYTTDDGLPRRRWVINIYPDANGDLWLGTWVGGLVRYDGKRFVTYTVNDGLPHNKVWGLCADTSGHLWIGTEGGGVGVFDGHRFTNYTTDDRLQHNDIRQVIADREGQLWFTHWLSGLSCLDVRTFQWLTQTTVSSIVIQDSQNRLWFSNDTALCCLSNGRQHQRQFEEPVIDLLEDSTSAFWVATRAGLYRFDSVNGVWEASPQHFTPEDELNSTGIMGLLETRDGTIWAGTWDNPEADLCRFDGGGEPGADLFHAIPTPHEEVSRLYEDRHGNIWLGGVWGGGLSRYDGEHLITYTTADGLPDENVQSIVEDDNGHLWIGTEGGLCRYDGERFLSFGKAEGLSSLTHSCAAKDTKTGDLWFGTAVGGLYRYNKRHFQQLTKEAGLPSNNVTGILPQQDGTTIIATSHGIVRYTPTATLPPNVQIREVVADQIYSNPGELSLTTTGADLLTIAYHGMSLATQKMRYSYILEGYNHDWTDTWDSQVRYEKLPVGEYIFKVIAINRDLVESESPATLKLTVVPDPRDQQIERLQTELSVTRRLIAQQFNPYIVGRVVGREMYFGRDELIDEIQRTVANNCFLVYGERRIGKTSLQHQLRERLQDNADETIRFIPAYIDMQGVAEEDFFATIATSVAEACHPHITQELVLRINDESENYTYRHLNGDLRTLLNHLMENEGRKTVKLVLLMDEIYTLNQYQLRTNLHLRRLFMGRWKENLSLVMTGYVLKTDWSGEGGGSPPFNFLSREIHLQPLDNHSARQLITAPIEGVYTYEPVAIEKIIAYSDNKPFTIQAFCMRAVNRILSDARTQVRADDIEAIKDAVLAEVTSIRGERAGTSMPGSFNEALARLSEESSRNATLESEIKALREQISAQAPED